MVSKTENAGGLTEASLKKLKVTELREKLAEESLDTKGVKDELVKRLLEHFEAKKGDDHVAGEAPAAGQEATAGGEPTAEAAATAPTGAPGMTGTTGATDGNDAKAAATLTQGMTEQEKAKARAERFGIPEKTQLPGKAETEAKEQHKKKAGICGLGDVDRKEEFERRKKRAERFGLPVPVDTEEEQEKKKKRAERFGMPAPPPSALEVAAKLKAREERFGKQ